MFQSSLHEEDKLKTVLNDQKSTSKKIRLSPMPKVETAMCNGINKRNLDGQNQVMNYYVYILFVEDFNL